MTVTFGQYTQHLKHSDIPFLGELIWYSVPMRAVAEYQPFVEALTDNGLDDRIPKPPSDADVFRRACTAAARKRVPVSGRTDVYENVLLRDVRTAAGHVWRQIVIEEVDGQNKRLSYEPKMELEYDPDIQDIIPTWLSTFHSTTDVVAGEIARDFAEWKGKLHSESIRQLIRGVVLSSRATIVRESGGVYFVMQDRIDRVRALERVLNTTGLTGEGVRVVTVPLIDDQNQREMIRRSFEDESVGEVQHMINEINDLLSGPEVTERKFLSMTKRMKDLKAKANDYTQLLDNNLDTTQLRLQALETRMLDLFKHQK